MAIYKDKKQSTWFVDLRYRDFNGNIKSKKKRGFRTKKDAEAFEKSLKFDDDNSVHTFTFEEMMILYFESRIGIANDATRRDQENRLRKYVSSMMYKTLPIRSNLWVNWRNKLGTYKLSSVTKNSCIKLVKAVSKFGYLNYDIQDTAKGLQPFNKPFEEQTEKRVMNVDEYNLMIKNVNNKVIKVFLEFCYFTGVRRSEALALQLSDFDINTKTVSINKSLPHRQYGSRKGLSSLKTPKSYRTLKLDDELITHLIPLLKQEGPYVFGGKEPLSTSTITRVLKQAEKAAKIPNYTLHEFRHSNGSLLLDANVPLIKVSKRLGHSSVDITARVYAHSLKNVDEESAEVFNYLRSK